MLIIKFKVDSGQVSGFVHKTLYCVWTQCWPRGPGVKDQLYDPDMDTNKAERLNDTKLGFDTFIRRYVT